MNGFINKLITGVPHLWKKGWEWGSLFPLLHPFSDTGVYPGTIVCIDGQDHGFVVPWKLEGLGFFHVFLHVSILWKLRKSKDLKPLLVRYSGRIWLLGCSWKLRTVIVWKDAQWLLRYVTYVPFVVGNIQDFSAVRGRRMMRNCLVVLFVGTLWCQHDMLEIHGNPLCII